MMFISDTEAESKLGKKFGALTASRHDTNNGAIVRLNKKTGLTYGVDSIGLYWFEIDVNRFRYLEDDVLRIKKRNGDDEK